MRVAPAKMVISPVTVVGPVKFEFTAINKLDCAPENVVMVPSITVIEPAMVKLGYWVVKAALRIIVPLPFKFVPPVMTLPVAGLNTTPVFTTIVD